MISKLYIFCPIIISLMNLGLLIFNLYFVNYNDKFYKDLIHSILKGFESNSKFISTLNLISLTDEQKSQIQKNMFGK